jgi:MFS family permease
MADRRQLGRQFGWLWAAYTASTVGTWLGFGAFPLIAILVLHSGSLAVSLLGAGGLAGGAIAAIPLGPWVEFRRKRGVMIAMDLIRFAALASVPAVYALGWLSFAQLLIVSVVVAAANNAFMAASGAYLKALVPKDDLIIANARFESTTWTATIFGPPLGGIAIGAFGPVTTVVIDAVSYLLSALGVGAIRGEEHTPKRIEGARRRFSELLDGWRYILTHCELRLLFFNSIFVNGLIMVSAPLMAVLMLGRLGFTPWQYGLAFGLPCIGGLIGSRMARPLVARLGQRRTILVTGTLRAFWPLGLAFVGRGVPGLVLIIVIQFGLVLFCGAFNPVSATFRLQQIEVDRVARTLSAWSITSSLTTATLTAFWGLLASITGPRAAIALAGVLLLGTPFLLPRRNPALGHEPETARSLV